jgi:hypothetical protein
MFEVLVARHTTGRRRRPLRWTYCRTQRLSAGGPWSRTPLARSSRNCCRKWMRGRASKSVREPRLQKQSPQPRYRFLPRCQFNTVIVPLPVQMCGLDCRYCVCLGSFWCYGEERDQTWEGVLSGTHWSEEAEAG